MLCAKCNYDNPADALFCMKCGSKVENRCSSCNTINPADAKFCRKCGGALGAGAPASSPRPAAAATTPRVEVTHERKTAEGLEGERKTVTALFADIKGSTELMRDLDPEEARAIVDPVLDLMMEAVHRYGGYVAQSTGDGIFALFGAPVAYEDHPQRALHAALAMQEELRRYADRLRAEGKIPVEARVGVNTGVVVVRTIETGGHTEYTPVGHVTNLAARMQTAAPPGSIAASETTQRLCEGYFEFRALGPTAVKGLNAPVQVYEVTGLGPLRSHFQLSARRGLTKFVGREREIAAMKRALELARSGHAQIVAAVGEAGAGKSRLMYEFKATIPDGCKVLEAYSVSHGKASAWLPVLELLKSYFEIADDDDDGRRSEKVEAKARGLDPALAETLPYILSLLGIAGAGASLAMMDAQIRRRRTLEAIKRIIIRESLSQPLVVIFEDLHWIDAETQKLLDLLVDSVASARILMLVNYRPEYHHAWGNRACYTQLRLDPLGGQSADEMLHALLGGDPSLQSLKRLIIDKTQGNPFFIEEMVRALVEQGVLVRNGATRLTKPVTEIHIPPTVHGILASRIDALPASEKGLLQTLAVIGKDFPLNLVKRMSASPDDRLEPMLKGLQAGEFIYEQPALGETEYTFKHALTQEVAYNSVLVERRRLLHERTGEAIEALFKDRIDDHLAELAHHYSRTANTRKAVEYLFRAGRQAAARSAYSEAVTRLSSALEFLKRLPNDDERARQELSVQSVLGLSLAIAKGFAAAELEPVYARARELCAKVRDPALTFRPLYGQWTFRHWQLELRRALELADELLVTAEDAEEPAMLLCSNLARGATLIALGELVSGNEHLEKALAAFDLRQPLSTELEAQRLFSFSCLYFGLYGLGYPNRAWARSREMLEVAQRSSAPYILAYASCDAAAHHLARGDSTAAQACAEKGMALAEEIGIVSLSASASARHGASLIAQGRHEEGIAEMRRGISAIRATGGTAFAWYLCLLASGLGKVGRPEKGLQVLEEGFASVAKTGRGIDSPYLHHVKGELLLVQNPSDVAEAEQCFRTAIEIARGQSARSPELRASTSLARLLAKQGQRGEARAMLAKIYNWFTEGVGTRDLKDAKALLDELNVDGGEC
jgi:class 3 adenylate cyclase/tetratricopeptide (TPR) repeat protein/ribosomal protein L40E